MQPMKITGDRQQHHGRTLKDLAYADDGLTIKAVCHMSDQESQQQHWQKLHQPHHTKGKGTMLQRIHLPANSNSCHLERQRRAYSREPEPCLTWFSKFKFFPRSLVLICHTQHIDVYVF